DCVAVGRDGETTEPDEYGVRAVPVPRRWSVSALNTSRIFSKKCQGLSCHNGAYGCSTKTLDNATANINNMLSHTGYTPKRLELLANNHPNQPTIAQNLTINVSGVESPHEATALTGEAVQRNNAILVRNLQTKMS
ncbi:hypothetical protein KKJ30_20890, partial [Xenorhabdus bovienii]|nr:hypothetical protein [Xenorhabdus bovienii]